MPPPMKGGSQKRARKVKAINIPLTFDSNEAKELYLREADSIIDEYLSTGTHNNVYKISVANKGKDEMKRKVRKQHWNLEKLRAKLDGYIEFNSSKIAEMWRKKKLENDNVSEESSDSEGSDENEDNEGEEEEEGGKKKIVEKENYLRSVNGNMFSGIIEKLKNGRLGTVDTEQASTDQVDKEKQSEMDGCARVRNVTNSAPEKIERVPTEDAAEVIEKEENDEVIYIRTVTKAESTLETIKMRKASLKRAIFNKVENNGTKRFCDGIYGEESDEFIRRRRVPSEEAAEVAEKEESDDVIYIKTVLKAGISTPETSEMREASHKKTKNADGTQHRSAGINGIANNEFLRAQRDPTEEAAEKEGLPEIDEIELLMNNGVHVSTPNPR